MRLPTVPTAILFAVCSALTGAEVNVFSGSPNLDEVPAGSFKTSLTALRPDAQARALAQLSSAPTPDVASLRVTEDGDLYYHCSRPALDLSAEPQSRSIRGTGAAPVAISNPPKLHSKKGAGTVIFLDFNGGTVTGTEWNKAYKETSWKAKPYSTDADLTTFSDAEQAAIRIIWERVSEDYSSFDVDITTEAPASLGAKTAWVLITDDVDVDDKPLPHQGAGGVAFLSVFGKTDYQKWSPAWVLDYGNPSDRASKAIGDAASHEVGHNLGLDHDGYGATEYEEGFPGSATSPSWGPIMGAPYDITVSHWSKGDYLNSSNKEDDLAIIAKNMPFRTDDHGGAASPTSLKISNKQFSTTGRIEKTSDIDAFRISFGAGEASITATPYFTDGGTDGGNLDIKLSLTTAQGTVVATANPGPETAASIVTTVTAGTYIILVEPTGAGNPNGERNGFTVYGSLGQYTIRGTGEVGSTNNGVGGSNDTGIDNNNSGGEGVDLPGPTYDGADRDDDNGRCGLGSSVAALFGLLALLGLHRNRRQR